MNELVKVESNKIKLLDKITKQEEKNEVLGYVLDKGKYDINYVIKILQIILEQCEIMRFSPRDLQFTLSQSLKRLLAMLIVERNQDNTKK